MELIWMAFLHMIKAPMTLAALRRIHSLIFRKGQIEAVFADFVKEHNGRRIIPSLSYENYLVQGVLNYFGVLKALEIPNPLIVLVSMTGVANVYMGVNVFYISSSGAPIDRDTLVLPDIIIEDYESISDKNEVARILRPIFDAIWNACGYECSYNYDDAGNWNPKR